MALSVPKRTVAKSVRPSVSGLKRATTISGRPVTWPYRNSLHIISCTRKRNSGAHSSTPAKISVSNTLPVWVETRNATLSIPASETSHSARPNPAAPGANSTVGKRIWRTAESKSVAP